MRNLFALLLMLGLIAFINAPVVAQEESQAGTEEQAAAQENPDSNTAAAAEEEAAAAAAAEEEAAAAAAEDNSDEEAPKKTGFQTLKEKFIEGGWQFMSTVLVCLILGLAFAIERIITLNIATVNTEDLLAKIDDRLKNNDMDGALEVCKSTPGPTASILYQGLKNVPRGADAVEKAIVAYGNVQMGMLEKGLVWISLFIAIAPMLGFMGTVIGMIQAFDKIEKVGDLSPAVVAGGIKVALLTTVFGLITAIILQIFYNYIVSKIDSIVNKMEEATIEFIDILIDNNMLKH